MPLIVSKKKELIGSVAEDRGKWEEIIALEIDIPDDRREWTLQITGSAVVSRMQFRFRKDEQILDWVFGTGARSNWEQQSAIDIIQGVPPGRHKITLEGTMGTAMRRRLVVVAWPEEVPGSAASSNATTGRKSTVKKKVARKAPRKQSNAKAAVPKKKRVVKKKVTKKDPRKKTSAKPVMPKNKQVVKKKVVKKKSR